jgi:branched-chain amino acid transport system substrate-binding protein
MKKTLFPALLFIILNCVRVEAVKVKEDINVAYNMAMEAYTRQEYKEASDLFIYVFKNTEDNSIKSKSLFYLGEIYRTFGKYGSSLLSYSMADFYGLDCLENIKEIAPNADIKSIEKSVEYAPIDLKPYLLYIAARKYQKEGNERKSNELFAKIIAEYPNTVYARQAQYLEKAKGEYRVGVLLPLTGSYSDIGESVKRGIEIGSKDKFIPIYTDTKGNPLISYKEAKRLIKNEKVSGIIGPLLSLNSFSVACLTDYIGIPLVSPTATQELIDSIGDRTFIINRSLYMQANAMAYYAINELGLESFSILYPLTEYGETLQKNFKDAVTKFGGQIVSQVAYKEGDPDFKDELTLINESASDALYIPALTPDIPLIAPQLKYFKIKSQILGANGWESDEIFHQIEESYLNGVVITGQPHNPTEDFKERFKFVYRSDPDRYACLGYDAANLLDIILQNPNKRISRSDISFSAGSLEGEEFYDSVPLYIINNGEFRSIK